MKRQIDFEQYPVFRVLTAEERAGILADSEVDLVRTKKGMQVEAGAVYLVLAGTLSVYSVDSAHPLLLRYLKAGDIFGIAGVFHAEAEMSRVIAKSEGKILRIPFDTIQRLLSESEAFRTAYLRCLAERIAFLNRKITFYTAGSSERKLAAYLLTVSDEDEYTLPVSIIDLAKQLDLGRASLYRAFDVLSESGYIRRNGKQITICKREELL